MAKLTLTDIASGYNSTTVINANNALIETALENTLSRDGTSPNTMGAELDMNSNNINNLPDATQAQQPVTLAQLQAAAVGGASVAASLVTITDAGGLYVSNNVEGALQEITTSWPQSALETANAITPTDTSYPWGDIRRYGAVGDSTLTTAGTDNTSAIQDAIDSGHKVYFAPGFYAVEGTLEVFGNAADGTCHMEGTATCRLQRFDASNSAPILHMAGTGITLEGNGMIFAARNGVGGWNKGAVLIGPDPAATSNADSSMLDTTNNWIGGFKILGQTANTGYDGSVGLYCESAARRRGQYITPTTLNHFYNMYDKIYVIQMDYGIFLSTDANANTFSGCCVNDYGHAAVLNNGYGNQFTGFITEKATAQDTTERAVLHFGEKDFGPESVHELTDEDATMYAITGVTKGSTTTIHVASHTFVATDLIRITSITDSGAGDLEAALNGGHFEVLSQTATTIVISTDTSSVSATWSSGGNAIIAPYPIYGAYANAVDGWGEFAYDASTRKVRLCLFEDPLIDFTGGTRSALTNNHKNIVRMSGAHPGGIALSGNSGYSSIFRNRVDNTTVGFTDYQPQVRFGDLTTTRLDDDTGFSFGSDNVRSFAGRMGPLAESTNYDVFVQDDVGVNEAACLFKLSYVAKEDVNNNVEAGEISWLCPVTASTNRTAIKIKDFKGNENAPVGITWSVVDAAGTTASHGKFTLRCTTGSVSGTGSFYVVWKLEVLHTELNGTTLDWEAESSVPNGGF